MELCINNNNANNSTNNNNEIIKNELLISIEFYEYQLLFMAKQLKLIKNWNKNDISYQEILEKLIKLFKQLI